MGNFIKTFSFVVIVLFVVSCATKVANTIAHTEPVPSKSEVLDTFSIEQLAHGQAYFEESCTRCHKLFPPESRDPEKWNNVLKRMLPKTELTQGESELVRAYLIANSK